jgi:hypothetical protein
MIYSLIVHIHLPLFPVPSTHSFLRDWATKCDSKHTGYLEPTAAVIACWEPITTALPRSRTRCSTSAKARKSSALVRSNSSRIGRALDGQQGGAQVVEMVQQTVQRRWIQDPLDTRFTVRVMRDL